MAYQTLLLMTWRLKTPHFLSNSSGIKATVPRLWPAIKIQAENWSKYNLHP